MTKILQLTSYPLKKRIHGGQIRCYQLSEVLRTAGHDVVNIAIFLAEHYSDYYKSDISVMQSMLNLESYFDEISDYLVGKYAATDQEINRTISKVVVDNDIEYIFVEQPWLYSVAVKAAKLNGCKVVYSSQNIEWRLKYSMMEKYPDKEIVRDYIKEIRELESDVVKGSDYCIACTEADANELKSMGGREVFLAPNAASPFEVDVKRATDWYWHFGRKPYAVFVGSAHTPNVTGFWNMLSPGLTFLAPDQKIVVLGGVGPLLFSHSGSTEFEQLNRDRVVITGYLEKSELEAIVLGSSVVILPITEGEGSNLKTAEALLSGKKVIGTRKAFRGYEYAIGGRNVSIADSPDDFRMEIKNALDEARGIEPVFSPPEPVEQLTWEYAMSEVVNLVGEGNVRK